MLALLTSLSVLSTQLTAAFAQDTSASLPISVPLSAPSSVATLNPDLLSFSIEQDLWTEWAGTSSPNTFFLNALGNLAQRTGQTPWIRIGADSEDHTNFNAAVQVCPSLHVPERTLTSDVYLAGIRGPVSRANYNRAVP